MASRRSKKKATPRWLAWVVGLLAAGLGVWALTSRPTATGPPLDDIDDESRERLERVLRDADPATPR